VGQSGLEKENSLTPLEVETRLIQTGKIIEKDSHKFVRINALNALTNNLTNNLTREDYSYSSGEIDLGRLDDSLFETLATCNAGIDCLGGYICIEGTCRAACNSTFNDQRCSNDLYYYTNKRYLSVIYALFRSSAFF